MAILDNVAKAKNVNPQQLKVGFEKMLNVLERTGRISSINKPGFDPKSLASKTIVKDIAMMKTFNPMVRLASKYGEIQAGGVNSSLGKIFANDEAVESLIRLAKTDPQSKQAIMRVLQLVNIVQQTTPRDIPNP